MRPGDISVCMGPFDQRTHNCLKRGGLDTLGRVIRATDAELLSIRGFGLSSLEQVHRFKLAMGHNPHNDAPKSLRDEFAMAALPGILANPEASWQDAAIKAYTFADQMMIVRSGQ